MVFPERSKSTVGTDFSLLNRWRTVADVLVLVQVEVQEVLSRRDSTVSKNHHEIAVMRRSAANSGLNYQELLAALYNEYSLARQFS